VVPRLPAYRAGEEVEARWLSQPAAIWDRPALCTQTNRTLGFSDIAAASLVPYRVRVLRAAGTCPFGREVARVTERA
jgi:hypothetical protein